MKRLKFITCIFFCFFTINFSFAQTEIESSTLLYESIHFRGYVSITVYEQTFNGQLTFVNVIDSFLYMQLNVAGFEAGRVLLTPDNVLFINKLQKNYYDGDYTFFQQLIDVDIDFYTLQAIFNGFSIEVPEEIELAYERDPVAEYSFFNILTLEHEWYPLGLKLEVKRVTFNDVPKVSANVPKSYSVIVFDEE
jgi:hypothetical protein